MATEIEKARIRDELNRANKDNWLTQEEYIENLQKEAKREALLQAEEQARAQQAEESRLRKQYMSQYGIDVDNPPADMTPQTLKNYEMNFQEEVMGKKFTHTQRSGTYYNDPVAVDSAGNQLSRKDVINREMERSYYEAGKDPSEHVEWSEQSGRYYGWDVETQSLAQAAAEGALMGIGFNVEDSAFGLRHLNSGAQKSTGAKVAYVGGAALSAVATAVLADKGAGMMARHLRQAHLVHKALDKSGKFSKAISTAANMDDVARVAAYKDVESLTQAMRILGGDVAWEAMYYANKQTSTGDYNKEDFLWSMGGLMVANAILNKATFGKVLDAINDRIPGGQNVVNFRKADSDKGFPDMVEAVIKTNDQLALPAGQKNPTKYEALPVKYSKLADNATFAGAKEGGASNAEAAFGTMSQYKKRLDRIEDIKGEDWAKRVDDVLPPKPGADKDYRVARGYNRAQGTQVLSSTQVPIWQHHAQEYVINELENLKDTKLGALHPDEAEQLSDAIELLAQQSTGTKLAQADIDAIRIAIAKETATDFPADFTSPQGKRFWEDSRRADNYYNRKKGQINEAEPFMGISDELFGVAEDIFKKLDDTKKYDIDPRAPRKDVDDWIDRYDREKKLFDLSIAKRKKALQEETGLALEYIKNSAINDEGFRITGNAPLRQYFEELEGSLHAMSRDIDKIHAETHTEVVEDFLKLTREELEKAVENNIAVRHPHLNKILQDDGAKALDALKEGDVQAADKLLRDGMVTSQVGQNLRLRLEPHKAEILSYMGRQDLADAVTQSDAKLYFNVGMEDELLMQEANQMFSQYINNIGANLDELKNLRTHIDSIPGYGDLRGTIDVFLGLNGDRDTLMRSFWSNKVMDYNAHRIIYEYDMINAKWRQGEAFNSINPNLAMKQNVVPEGTQFAGEEIGRADQRRQFSFLGQFMPAGWASKASGFDIGGGSTGADGVRAGSEITDAMNARVAPTLLGKESGMQAPPNFMPSAPPERTNIIEQAQLAGGLASMNNPIGLFKKATQTAASIMDDAVVQADELLAAGKLDNWTRDKVYQIKSLVDDFDAHHRRLEPTYKKDNELFEEWWKKLGDMKETDTKLLLDELKEVDAFANKLIKEKEFALKKSKTGRTAREINAKVKAEADKRMAILDQNGKGDVKRAWVEYSNMMEDNYNKNRQAALDYNAHFKDLIDSGEMVAVPVPDKRPGYTPWSYDGDWTVYLKLESGQTITLPVRDQGNWDDAFMEIAGKDGKGIEGVVDMWARPNWDAEDVFKWDGMDSVLKDMDTWHTDWSEVKRSFKNNGYNADGIKDVILNNFKTRKMSNDAARDELMTSIMRRIRVGSRFNVMALPTARLKQAMIGMENANLTQLKNLINSHVNNVLGMPGKMESAIDASVAEWVKGLMDVPVLGTTLQSFGIKNNGRVVKNVAGALTFLGRMTTINFNPASALLQFAILPQNVFAKAGMVRGAKSMMNLGNIVKQAKTADTPMYRMAKDAGLGVNSKGKIGYIGMQERNVLPSFALEKGERVNQALDYYGTWMMNTAETNIRLVSLDAFHKEGLARIKRLNAKNGWNMNKFKKTKGGQPKRLKSQDIMLDDLKQKYQGISDEELAEKYAVKMMYETNFDFDVSGQTMMTQNPFLKVGTQFKTYVFNQFEFLLGMKETGLTAKERFMSFAMLTGMGGAMSLPFVEDIDQLGVWMFGVSPKQWMYDNMPDVVTMGMPTMAGFTFSQNLAMGGASAFNVNPMNGTFISKMHQFWNNANNGAKGWDETFARASSMSSRVYDMYNAIRYGVYKTGGQTYPVDNSWSSILTVATGMQVAEEKKNKEKFYIIRDLLKWESNKKQAAKRKILDDILAWKAGGSYPKNLVGRARDAGYTNPQQVVNGLLTGDKDLLMNMQKQLDALEETRKRRDN